MKDGLLLLTGEPKFRLELKRVADDSQAGGAEPTAAGSGQTCPECKSGRVFRSHRRTLVENIRSWWLTYPYRCHDCGARFWVHPGEPDGQRGRIDSRPELRHRRMHRWMREVLIGGILVALFLAFLYYLMQPHNYGVEGQ